MHAPENARTMREVHLDELLFDVQQNAPSGLRLVLRNDRRRRRAILFRELWESLTRKV
jgi:hypothetical protein